MSSLTPVPRGSSTLTANDAKILQSVRKTYEKVQQQKTQHAMTQQHVNWLQKSNDFLIYNKVKKQTQQFKLAFYLALTSLIILFYVDTMFFVALPSYMRNEHQQRYFEKKEQNYNSNKYYHHNHRNDNTNEIHASFSASFGSLFPLPPFVGSGIASITNIYIHYIFSGFVVLFLLPWTIMGVWSVCDENPQEGSKNLLTMVATHARAYFLTQFAYSYIFGMKMDSLAPFGASSESANFGGVLKDGFSKSLTNNPAFARVVCAMIIPILVPYVMFYRKFGKFWKKKELVSSPLILYSMQLGLVLVFDWWFFSTAFSSSSSSTSNNRQQQSFSIDNTISLISSNIKQVFSLLFFTKSDNRKADAKTLREAAEFSRKIYILLVPYCGVLLATSVVPRYVGKLIRFITPSHESAVDWLLAIFIHYGIMIWMILTGNISIDSCCAAVIGACFSLMRLTQNGMEDPDPNRGKINSLGEGNIN